MQRKLFIDWARGFAVIAMVLWHTADGWLAPSMRVGQSWSLLRFIGGLAAPSFLVLAGVGAGLAARGRPTSTPLIAELARGLEIMLIGYALRLQTWLIDAAAITKLYLLRSWLPLGAGYVLLFLSLRSLRATPRRARWFATLGAAACAIGLAQVSSLAPGRLPRLLQVDVLQAIGASLVLLALGERAFHLLQRPLLAAAIGAVAALAPEFVSGFLPGPVPVPIAAYFAKFAAAPGAPSPALFPLLPWFSYACSGAALGTLLRTQESATDTLVVRAGLMGAVLALLTSEAHPLIQRAIATAAWSMHPLRVAFRVGLVLVLLLLGWLWSSGPRGAALITYGRASLRVYWAHLLVAYGALGSPWHKQLHMGEWAARVLGLMLLMWLLARVGAVRAPPKLEAPARLYERG